MIGEINIDLLRRVQAAILQHPESFDMHRFFAGSDNSLARRAVDCGLEEPREVGQLRTELESHCGTTACIAGWTLALTDTPFDAVEDPNDDGIACRAAEMLGIEYEMDGVVAKYSAMPERLFFVDAWPDDLLQRYDEAQNGAERARVTSERIERFIETGGKE